MTPGLRNVSLRQYRRFLQNVGCACVRTTGGHEHWTRAGLLRPITVQTHVDPVPEMIVKSGLRILGMSREQFWAALA